MLSIFVKPVSCAFVVAPEKSAAFLHEKSDPKAKETILKRAKKLEEQMKKNAENNPHYRKMIYNE